MLSVIILTKNEEKNILDCLEGVLQASEVLIIDDYSTDRTLEVIRSLNRRNIKIVEHPLGSDFSEQRNFGLSKAKNEWVMFLDADERVSRKLFDEIAEKIKKTDISGFRVKRKDFLWGKKLEHGETGNMSLVRIGRKNAGKWELNVHEVWDIKGRVEDLENELMHYPHQTISDFLREIDYYSTIRAGELNDQGEKVFLFDLIIYPKAKFFLNYILKLGFIDGIPGLVMSLMMSFHSFLVRGKLWLLQNNEK